MGYMVFVKQEFCENQRQEMITNTDKHNSLEATSEHQSIIYTILRFELFEKLQNYGEEFSQLKRTNYSDVTSPSLDTEFDLINTGKIELSYTEAQDVLLSTDEIFK